MSQENPTNPGEAGAGQEKPALVVSPTHVALWEMLPHDPFVLGGDRPFEVTIDEAPLDATAHDGPRRTNSFNRSRTRCSW